MPDEELDQLLLMWREKHDEMMDTTANQRRRRQATQERIAELEQPFKDELKVLENQIEPYIMVKGSTYNELPGVVAQYRGGYIRVSYERMKVDVVLGFLRDIAPNAAEQLAQARKQSHVPPKVTVEARKG